MLETYCLQANLQALLDCNHEIQDIIPEALEKLKAINREDHRGSFAETDLSAWSSTVFKSITSTVTLPELQQISIWLSNRYSIPLPHWHGKVTSKVADLEGIALGRVIYSPAGIQLNNSYVVVQAEGPVTSRRAGRQAASYKAGQILHLFSHLHPHPETHLVTTETFVVLSILEPIEADDDPYRKLQMGWLCKKDPNMTTTTTMHLSSLISHFVKTDLVIRGQDVIHVLPCPKVNAHLVV